MKPVYEGIWMYAVIVVAVASAALFGGPIAGIATGVALYLGITVTSVLGGTGHQNPAVTFMTMLDGSTKKKDGILIIVAQFLAAIVAGFSILHGIIPGLTSKSLSRITPTTRMDLMQAMPYGQAILTVALLTLSEAILTFFLGGAVYSVTKVSPTSPRTGGLAIGVWVALASIFFGGIMNPAIWLALTYASGTISLDNVQQIIVLAIIFVGGPFLGAGAAKFVFGREL